IDLLRADGLPKGDALAVARIAGIMGAKKTPDLIPLCHPIAISGFEAALVPAQARVDIPATVHTADRPGVEMEALTAVATAGAQSGGGGCARSGELSACAGGDGAAHSGCG
ncbi:hypothetical protein B4Q13_25555, partial [Lacticaseibacillus rhamnosus]